jgi:hypothetical protein
MRRSTVQAYAREVAEDVMCHFLEKKEKLAPEEAKEKVIEMFIEEGTPEGIIDHIQETKHRIYHIFSTEFGAVLMRSMSRDYEVGICGVLSKLYYGEPAMMVLSRRGRGNAIRYLPSNLYTTLFAGMQEPKHYLTHQMIRQGLIRRLLICYAESEDVRGWLEPLSSDMDEVNYVLMTTKETLYKMVERLIQITKGYYLNKIQVHFVPPAMKEINDIAKILEEKVLSDPSDVNIYRQTFWEHLAKLSTISAIANQRFAEVGGEVVLNVTPEDIQKARRLYDFVDRKVSSILLNIEQVEAKITVYTFAKEKIIEILGSNGGGMRYGDLLAKTGMLKEDFDKILDTLWSARIVRKELTNDGKVMVYLENYVATNQK